MSVTCTATFLPSARTRTVSPTLQICPLITAILLSPSETELTRNNVGLRSGSGSGVAATGGGAAITAAAGSGGRGRCVYLYHPKPPPSASVNTIAQESACALVNLQL